MFARSPFYGRSVALAILSSGVIVSACATSAAIDADAVPRSESAARISAGMSRLGASPDRSNCYADKIASALTGPDSNEAVRIIETSISKEEMRSGVLSASAPVKQSFIRAHFGCSFLQ